MFTEMVCISYAAGASVVLLNALSSSIEYYHMPYLSLDKLLPYSCLLLPPRKSPKYILRRDGFRSAL